MRRLLAPLAVDTVVMTLVFLLGGPSWAAFGFGYLAFLASFYQTR